VSPVFQYNETGASGLTKFKLITNGILVEDSLDLQLTLNGADIQSAWWDSDTFHYIFNTPISTDGVYDATVTVYDTDGIPYVIKTAVEVHRKRLYCHYSETGTVGFSLTSSLEESSIRIDWGLGTGFETRTYTIEGTLINKPVTITGAKQLILEKAYFDDIVEFACTGMGLNGLNFQEFVKLKNLSLNNTGISGKLYLNGLAVMEYITIEACDLTALEIGLMTNLSAITITACDNFGASGIDNLIAQIYELRDHFFNTIVVHFSGTGYAFSTVSTAMINGTGTYAGKGLNTDYGFDIAIV
jgi:hypothetical protein